ncbi:MULTISPECIES: Ig-like domain-containing protein [unclassified Pantoea]|uniref:Ig-like domain-containing protein n=1 Tax=unclassified Pantoea TaxID=2630326 RepID=UPI0022699223|nr:MULTISPECIES: Ig-like domain-containing protein [unclassified Pantoea]
MAFSGTGRVTVVSLTNGQTLSQFTADKLHSVLNEPAIITLQGPPSQVSSYQKQGQDLILNLQESDSLRYQNFFTDFAGQQSTLRFQEGNLLHQARFGRDVTADTQSVATLTPEWHSSDHAKSLTPFPAQPVAEPEPALSTVETTESLYLAPTDPALNGATVTPGVSSSEKNATLTLASTSETSTLSAPAASDDVKATTAAIPLPALTLDPVTGDNAVSYQEGIYGILFTGTAAHLASGTPIELTLDGRTWQGSVYQDKWQVQLSDSDVRTIQDGNHLIKVSATDPEGNSTSLSQNLLLITHYNGSNPKVTVNNITLADEVQHDGDTWYLLSGTLETSLPLKNFAVQVDDTFHWNYAVIQPDGSWRAEISASELSQGGNSLSFGVLDGAGNWFEQSGYVTADLTTPVEGGGGVPPITDDNPADGGNTPPADGGTPVPPVSAPPSLTINSFTGDGVLSAEEKLTSQTFSGTTENLAAESTLTIMLNGQSYTTTLAADGSWSVILPAADLQALPVGSNRISVTFENSAGGTTTASKAITVEPSVPPSDATPPQPTIDTPFGDGLMNASERFEPVTLSGSTGVTGAGQKITLDVDGVNYAGTVDSLGNWSVSLSALQLADAELAEGNHTITVTATDRWGQSGTSEATFITDTQDPLVRIDPLAGDGVIDNQEINSALVIAGSSEAGSTIEVTFGALHWSGIVDQNGQWQFPVPAETLQGMEEGSYSVVAKATDEAGNSRSASAGVQIYASDALPQLTLDPVTGDNAVSYQEGMYGIIFSGTAAHLPSGTPVELILDGRTWQGSVYQDKWQVQLSDSDVRTIQDGNYLINVSATDQNGNSTSLSQDLLLITHYNSSNPKVTVNDITQANQTEHDGETWYVISGTLEAPLPLQTFAVQVDDTFHWNYAVIQPDGSWRAEISASELSQGGNSLSFGVLDGAGNWFEQGGYVTVDLTSPVSDNSGDPVPSVPDNPTDGGSTPPVVDHPGEPAPVIDTPFGDGWLNRAEKKEGATLTGTTGVTGSGQTVTVMTGGKHRLAEVSDDGHWNLSLTPETMKKGFGHGQHDIVVTATDATGHTATITTTYQADACAPRIAFTHLTEGQKIDLNAGSLQQRISGTGEAGDIVTVSLGDHQWQTTVTSKGKWAVQPEALNTHTAEPGEYMLTASIRDAAGNVNHVSHVVELYTSDPQPALARAMDSTSFHHNSDGHSDTPETQSGETPSPSLLNLLTHLDSVAGHDTLMPDGSHEALDFASLGLSVSNSGVIDLNAFSSNSVTLEQKEQLPLTGDTRELMTIKEAEGNPVTLSTTEGGVWSEDGQRNIEGHQYDLYHTPSASHEGSLADLLIQHNLYA